jgi:hypothetical protein
MGLGKYRFEENYYLVHKSNLYEDQNQLIMIYFFNGEIEIVVGPNRMVMAEAEGNIGIRTYIVFKVLLF